jgi:hypothetical protein
MIPPESHSDVAAPQQHGPLALWVTIGPTCRRALAPPTCSGSRFGEFWPHQVPDWAQMALPRSLLALPPARSRSTWSARSEARTYDVDGRRVAAILGDEVGPEPIHDQRLQDRQVGPEHTRRWGPELTREARPSSPGLVSPARAILREPPCERAESSSSDTPDQGARMVSTIGPSSASGRADRQPTRLRSW